MADILFYRRPIDAVPLPDAARELVLRSQRLVAAARACSMHNRDASEHLRLLRMKTRDILKRSNEQLRQSAEQLFEEWNGTQNRSSFGNGRAGI